MEHFFNFFYAEAPNSAGANAFFRSHSNRMSVMIEILKVIEQNVSWEKYVFKTFSAIWKMFLSFNRISYNIHWVTVWEDKEWYCVTTDTILLIEKERAENKIAHAFLWGFQSYLFNYTTTERLHSLVANSTWLKIVKWWSVFDTCMIKGTCWLRDLEKSYTLPVDTNTE